MQGPQPGLVMVGSHVPLADQQLQQLLREPACEGLELPVARIARVLEGGQCDWLLPDLELAWRTQLEALLARGCTPRAVHQPWRTRVWRGGRGGAAGGSGLGWSWPD